MLGILADDGMGPPSGVSENRASRRTGGGSGWGTCLCGRESATIYPPDAVGHGQASFELLPGTLSPMKTTIVIADDHPIVLAGIRDLIDRSPEFEVIGQAQTPVALMQLLRLRQPDIVISDYNMPDDDELGDGIKLISYLTRHFPAIRLLILTMVSSPAIIAEMYRAGASGVVRKSGDLRELNAALIALAAQRQYRSPDLPAHGALPAAGDASATASLSPRELEVIRLFASGLSVGDIAKRLNRSSKTVSTQKVNAMRKLGAETDQELIAFCLKSSLFN